MNDFELLKEEMRLKEQAQSDVEYAKSLRVQSNEDLVTATEVVRQYKDQIKAVKDLFQKPKDLAWQTHRELSSREKELIAPFEEASKIIQRSMLSFKQAQERELQEQARRLEESRVAKEESLGELGEGDHTEEAEINELVISAEPPKLSGVYTQKQWGFEVEDLSKVPRTLAGVPLFKLDESAVRKLIDSGVRKIKGLKIFESERIVVRRK